MSKEKLLDEIKTVTMVHRFIVWDDKVIKSLLECIRKTPATGQSRKTLELSLDIASTARSDLYLMPEELIYGMDGDVFITCSTGVEFHVQETGRVTFTIYGGDGVIRRDVFYFDKFRVL